MVSTLIVRDATLAINGSPEQRGDPREHLLHRVSDVSGMDEETMSACIEVLQSVGSSDEDVDAEVLEALTILGLAQPQVAERMGISPVSSGRRFAARKEQEGEADYAIAVLECLLQANPHQPAVERDYAAILRRQGMVKDLVERYLARANSLLKEGREAEAVGWLREVLLLDASRKDAARMIRDLRLQEAHDHRARKQRYGTLIVVLLVSLGITFVVLREKKIREEFFALPGAEAGDLVSMRARLDALQGFVDDHPIWHGSLFAVAERTDLRGDVDRLEYEESVRREEEIARLREREEEARLAVGRAKMRVSSWNMEGAMEDLNRALELTSPDWELREQVERDIEAITNYLLEHKPASEDGAEAPVEGAVTPEVEAAGENDDAAVEGPAGGETTAGENTPQVDVGGEENAGEPGEVDNGGEKEEVE